MKHLLISILFTFIFNSGFSQHNYTRKDSLQGGLSNERISFNVLRYDLNVKIDIENKLIVGYNDIQIKMLAKKSKRIQLDLFENMKVDSIVMDRQKLNFKREFNAVFVDFPIFVVANDQKSIRIYYSGNPTIARRAPWDGGFVFAKDSNNKDFVAVACQSVGASLWFPCKDSQSDEPDNGATIKVTVPNGLTAVSNGRFKGSEDLKNGFTRWNWEVKNPINAYDISVNIADYVHFDDSYLGLDLDYYVLRENVENAKNQFMQVKPMLDCFQQKFGNYPFNDDGYKLVETPYLGMEHQSCVAYGNKYMNGYQGRDLSGTGIGLDFDYIIVHESGHEWFGNSITSKDIADMWIHEGFTMYSECVFVECQEGKERALEYINGMKQNVVNDKPIIGDFGVNKEGSGDMYYKGALFINTLRGIINDDDKWWKIIYKYSETFKHKIIATQDVIKFFNKESGLKLDSYFNQYLKTITIPKLELKIRKKKLEYKWSNVTDNYNMPVDIVFEGKEIRLNPTTLVQVADFKVKKMKEIKILTDKFFIDVQKN